MKESFTTEKQEYVVIDPYNKLLQSYYKIVDIYKNNINKRIIRIIFIFDNNEYNYFI